MANGQGTAIIDFGTMGGNGSNEAEIAVTGQTSILATSKVEAYIMADDTTSDHTASDHRYVTADLGLSCGTPTSAVGFTIYGRCRQKLTGKYNVRWVWTD
jgi:hypothetical protein